MLRVLDFRLLSLLGLMNMALWWWWLSGIGSTSTLQTGWGQMLDHNTTQQPAGVSSKKEAILKPILWCPNLFMQQPLWAWHVQLSPAECPASTAAHHFIKLNKLFAADIVGNMHPVQPAGNSRWLYRYRAIIGGLGELCERINKRQTQS